MARACALQRAGPGPRRRLPLGDAVYAAVRDAAAKDATCRRRSPVRGCSARAASWPRSSPRRAWSGTRSSSSRLQRNGIVEPSPHLLVVWGDNTTTGGDRRSSCAPSSARSSPMELPRASACGAVKRLADGTGAVVFALPGSRPATSLITRAVPAACSQPRSMRSSLMRFHDPQVISVTREDGDEGTARAARRSPSAFTSAVECGFAHRQATQIKDHGEQMPRARRCSRTSRSGAAVAPAEIDDSVEPRNDGPVVDRRRMRSGDCSR